MSGPIWNITPTTAQLNEMSRGNMAAHLGIEFVEIGDDYLKATMPVDQRTRQPFGLLHGGATVALAETLGSVASTLCVDGREKLCVGIAINANHIGQARSGLVSGVARPVHVGRTTQVWQIEIRSEDDRLISVCRLTMAVIDRRDG